MNDACTFEAAEAILGDLKAPQEGVFAFLTSRSKKSTRQLSEPIGEVFRGASELRDQMISVAIAARTGEEYDAILGEMFSKYAALTLSLSLIAEALVPKETFERIARESICELDADFRDKSLPLFGTKIREQALFTIWTIRKINDILPRLRSLKVLDESKVAEDRAFNKSFIISSLYAHFALDCLSAAMSLGKPIYPEVMDRLVDNLRSMVNAYTWARRSLALRIPEVTEPMEEPFADPDEQAFLDAAQHHLPDAEADDKWLNGA
jgi:hypothetical protein